MRSMSRHFKISLCAAVVALTSSACVTPPAPSAGATEFLETLDHVTDALSRLEGHRIVLLDHAHELRDGHEVICGLYGPLRGSKKSPNVKPFGWADGKLVMSWGPEVNPATRCLQENYDMPLV